MTSWFPSIPGPERPSLSGQRFLASFGTILFAIIAFGCLGLALLHVSSASSTRSELEGRLDGLMARPLPQQSAHSEAGESQDDDRVFQGSAEGIVASALQDRIAAIVDEAGLHLRRVSSEANPTDTERHRIVVRFEADGEIGALQTALFRIETNRPYLFVDVLEVQRSSLGAGERLDIKATVLANWREAKS